MALSEEVEELRIRVVGSEQQRAELEEKLKKLKESANSAAIIQTPETDSQLSTKLESLQADLSQKDQIISDLNNQIVGFLNSLHNHPNSKTTVKQDLEKQVADAKATSAATEDKFHKAKQFLREVNDVKKKLEADVEGYRLRVISIGSIQEQNVRFWLSLVFTLCLGVKTEP